MFVWPVVRELVANDSARMGNQGSNDIFFEMEGKIKVRPCLVPVLKYWHAEDEVMEILKIALTLSFVAEANDETVELDVSKCHIVRSTRHHLC